MCVCVFVLVTVAAVPIRCSREKCERQLWDDIACVLLVARPTHKRSRTHADTTRGASNVRFLFPMLAQTAAGFGVNTFLGRLIIRGQRTDGEGGRSGAEIPATFAHTGARVCASFNTRDLHSVCRTNERMRQTRAHTQNQHGRICRRRACVIASVFNCIG